MKKTIGLFVFLVLLGMQICFAQTRQVNGTVIDKSDGSPLPGVSVMVKGTSSGAATDVNGKFTLKVSDKDVLVVSFIGMKSQEILVGTKTTFNITMEPTTESLEEVVIVGYGTGQKAGTVTGSVSVVGNAKLKDRPVANVADALQGQVAGLQVFTSSGEPSANVSMRLRGVNSINAGNSPLFIIDGIPASSSAFTALNQNDIENVTLLKDASATAIYGSRAANGVLIITTKRGKSGEKAAITLRAQYGISSLTNNKLDMMNADEYLGFREMLDPSLQTNERFQNHKNFTKKHNISTDWIDYIFRDNAPTYQIDATVSGATDKTGYYISMGMYSQEGIAPRSDMKRYNLRSNIDTKINDIFRVGANISLSHQIYTNTVDTRNNWRNPANYAVWQDPSQSPYKITENADGSISYGERADYQEWTDYYDPIYMLENTTSDKSTTRLLGSTYLQVTPLQGLTLKFAQTADAFDYRYNAKNLPTDVLYDSQGKPHQDRLTGSVSESFQRYYSFTFTNTAEYKFNLADVHHFTLLAGQEAIAQKSDQFGVSKEGFTDKRLMLISGGTTAKDPTASRSETTYNSYFGRINYDYDNKYYVDASIRTDGSSVFGKNKRWGTFYSIGAMWNVKSESFLENVDVLDALRLKVSYGTVGNSSIDDYMWLGSMGTGKYNNENAWGISTPSNNDLTWETVNSLNVGLSARVFNRLNVEVDFYNKLTEDMLMEIPYSYTTGHGGGWGNVGSMRNRGLDVNVGVDILKDGDFYWNMTANFNYNKNEIVSLYNGLDEFIVPNTGIKYQVGMPYGEFYTVKWAGVDPRDGYQIWYDLDGNKTKEYSESDEQFIGKQRYAPWAGGISTTVAWKGITLSADFSWVYGKYTTNNDRFFIENAANGSSNNQKRTMLKMWTTPGQVTDIPRVESTSQFDSHLVEDASFGRLKNVTLSYSFPKSLLRKSRFIEGARVYAVGRNLLTITDYTGFDPENDTNVALGAYPNTKQYTFGVEITF